MAVTHRRTRLAFGCIATALIASGCNRANGASDSTKVAQSGGSGDTTPSTPTANIALPVTVEAARDGDLVLSIITSGQVRSARESKLKSEVTGTVQRVAVLPGQAVRRGQILVVLDSIPFVMTERQRQLEVDRANLNFLDLWVPDSLAGSRAGREDRRRAFLTRSGLDVARHNLDQARLDRERATIVAPFDGVVDRVEVTDGERIGSGQAIATVVDMQNLRIEAAVLEHDIPVIKAGGVATVASAASPNVLGRGRIIAVLPMVDSNTHAGRAYVQLVGNGVLRPGMSVDVRLEATRLLKRRLVPKQAVIERDGRPLVFVVKNGRAEWVYIQRGRDNGVETEVMADTVTNEIPIKPGDQIITRGHLTLTHQAQVRVIRKADTP